MQSSSNNFLISEDASESDLENEESIDTMNSSKKIYIRDFLADHADAFTRCIVKLLAMSVKKLKKIKIEKSLRNRLKRDTRYMYLLYFRRFDWESLIEDVYKVNVISDSDSRLYQYVYWQIDDWIKSWKNRALNKMTVSLMLWELVCMLTESYRLMFKSY